MDVTKASSILIIPKQSSEQAFWLATAALVKALAKTEKTYSLFFDKDQPADRKSIFPENTPFLNPEEDAGIIIALDNLGGKISDVAWNQIDDRLEVVIKTGKEEYSSPNVQIKQLASNFDLKIFIGLTKKEARTIPAIRDLKASSSASLFLKPEEFIQRIFEIIKALSPELDRDIADNLLLALYSYTDNFRINTNTDTFVLAAELAKIRKRRKPRIPRSVKPQRKITKKSVIEQPPAPTPKPVAPPVKSTVAPKSKNPLPRKPAPKLKQQSVEPQTLPPNYDPLAPATVIPAPLKLNGDTPVMTPVDNNPLPPAKRQ